jgi:hypothetical protein
MAISAARLNANRRNAKKSTGPITQQGKDRIRMNAWKHGFRSESGEIGTDESEAVEARREEWAGAFPTPPGDGYRRWLVDQIAIASVRIDRCQDHQRTQARYEADRAASAWDVDRAADASSLGARLADDPDRVVSQLRRSVAGVDWLLDRWRGLSDLLDAAADDLGEGPDGGGWDDARRRLCLDLMQTPAEFRESDRAMLAELPIGELRDLVREHVAGLESLREPAGRLDHSDRALAEIGLPTSEHSELRRLRIYESSLWRRFRALERSWKEARARDPEALDDPIEDDPIGDLLSYARMIEAEPEPEPGPPAEARSEPSPSPADRPGPPGPRPDRSASRNPLPSPRTRDEAPCPPEPRTQPANPTRPRISPKAEPILQNRRARRALRKAQAAGRRP